MLAFAMYTAADLVDPAWAAGHAPRSDRAAASSRNWDSLALTLTTGVPPPAVYDG